MRFCKVLRRLTSALIGVGALAAVATPASSVELKLNDGPAPYSLQVLSYRDIPFRTVVRQQFDYSCGSAAVATLLKYHYGQSVGEAEIFQSMYQSGDQATIQKVGFSLLDMKQYLTRQGYEADGYRMNLDELEKNNNPAIAVITVGAYRHFVIIKGVENGVVLVGDPALGLKRYPRADFEKMWVNNIVFMIHGGKADKGAFNLAEEWRPFTSPPVRPVVDSRTTYGPPIELPVIYQIQQLTPLQPSS